MSILTESSNIVNTNDCHPGVFCGFVRKAFNDLRDVFILCKATFYVFNFLRILWFSPVTPQIRFSKQLSSSMLFSN